MRPINKTSGFGLLSFVLIISSVLAFIILYDSYDSAVLETSLSHASEMYSQYYSDISCKELQALATALHKDTSDICRNSL
jgi:hypothetical protein